MRFAEILLVALTLAILLALVVGLTMEPAYGAEPTESLWRAMVQEESKGDPKAYNKDEKAAGIVQIRPICLRDCNRIAKLRGLDIRWTLTDRFSPAKSRAMWNLYLDFWGARYKRLTDQEPTDKIYAQLWNGGGPEGWKKKATLAYWQRVKANMKSVQRK